MINVDLCLTISMQVPKKYLDIYKYFFNVMIRRYTPIGSLHVMNIYIFWGEKEFILKAPHTINVSKTSSIYYRNILKLYFR